MSVDHLRSPICYSRVLLLAGPTAVGKSEIAWLLAEKVGGEIISVDSMQVYRGLDIGTAKPSPAERARVPHHLIDFVGVTEPFDAARFVRLARLAAADIQSRGRVPILCGGTGLYFKAFLEGLGEAPPADAALRAELGTTPLPDLLRELAERDPAAYERIDRRNPRRIIRALEVIRLTGKPFSQQRADWSPAPAATARRRGESRLNPEGFHGTHEFRKLSRLASHHFGLLRSPEDLRQRIDVRVDAMFGRGLVAETEELLKRGLAQNQTAMQALGYRQVVEYLAGARSLPETVELVKTRTRQFAKRQMTWFRRQLGLSWIQLEPGQAATAVAERLAGDIQRRANPSSV